MSTDIEQFVDTQVNLLDVDGLDSTISSPPSAASSSLLSMPSPIQSERNLNTSQIRTSPSPLKPINYEEHASTPPQHAKSSLANVSDYFSQVTTAAPSSNHELSNHHKVSSTYLRNVNDVQDHVKSVRGEPYNTSAVEPICQGQRREEKSVHSSGSWLIPPKTSNSTRSESNIQRSESALPQYPNQSYAALQKQVYPQYHYGPYNSRVDTSTSAQRPASSGSRNRTPPRSLSLQDRRAASTGSSNTPSLYTPSSHIARPLHGFEGTDERSPYPSPYLHPVQLQPPRVITNAKRDVDVFSGRKMINHYEILDELGRGVHGKVKLARDLDTGNEVAIKIVERFSKKRRLGKATSAENKVKKEVAILKKAQHPNVVRMIEVIDDPEVAKVYIVLEFCELKEINWRTLGTTEIVILENRRLEQESLGLPADEVIAEGDKTILAVTRRLEEAHIRPVHTHRTKSASHIWSLEYGGESDSDTDEGNELAQQPTESPKSGKDDKDDSSTKQQAGHTYSSYELNEFAPDHHTPGPVDITPRRRPSTSPNESSTAARETEFGSFETNKQSSFSPQWQKWNLPHADSFDENRGRRKTSVAESLSSQLTEIMQEEIPEDYRYVPTMTIAECRAAFRDALIGLDYLHYHGIIHRDIKPANLLRTKEHTVKISDFGVSYLGKPIRDGLESADTSGSESKDIEEETELAKTVGTPAFYAPELCSMDFTSDMPTVTGQIDVWALGATLYCLLFARTPFQGDNEFMLMRKIAEDEIFIPRMRLKAVDSRSAPRSPSFGLSFRNTDDRRLRDDFTHEHIDDELHDLLKRLFNKDPKKRITIKEIKHHRWILRDLQNPKTWPDETDPARYEQGRKIEISSKEVEDAVIPINFVKRFKEIKEKASNFLGFTGRRALNRAQNSANSSVATSVASSTHSLVDAAREESKKADESIVAALKAWRNHDQNEHPLSRSVTASPDPASTDDECDETSRISSVETPATDMHTIRPGMPDREISEMSTTASIKTIRAADMEHGRHSSISSIQEDMPGTQTLIESHHGSSGFSGIFGGSGRGLLKVMKSKEPLSPLLQSPTQAEHSSSQYGGPSVAISNTSAAGHVDVPTSLKDTSSPSSRSSSPKNSRKSSLAEIWDASRQNAQKSVKSNPHSTENAAIHKKSVSELHGRFPTGVTELSESQLQINHAMESIARRHAIELEQSQEHAIASRNASRNATRPSTASGRASCPPSPDDDDFAKTRQTQAQPFQGQYDFFNQQQSLNASVPYNRPAISSTSSDDQLASGLSQSTSYPSVQSVISVNTSLPEMEYMAQPKYDSSASSEGTVGNHNTVVQSNVGVSTEAGVDDEDEDAYAVETDEDDDSSDGDEGLLLMSRRRSQTQNAKGGGSGATAHLSRRRQTTLRRRTSTRSGSAHTMRKVRSHSIGEPEKSL